MRSWRVFGVLAAGPVLTLALSGTGLASTGCNNTTGHCYSTLQQQFSPGATEVWTNLKTYCLTLQPGAGNFDNNEIWALAPGSGNYVEFGHTRNGKSGVPTFHWFFAQTINGVQTGVESTRSFLTLTTYNATIVYSQHYVGSLLTPSWQFIAGRTQYGSVDYPAGPISEAEQGGEIGAGGTSGLSQQDSFYDSNFGRIQSGVRYSDWSGAPRFPHDVPPFDPNGAYSSNVFISDQNPSVPGTSGC